jgi:replication initiator protein
VVNGGGPVVVHYEKAGVLPAQRQVNPSWQDFASVPDVALIPYDTTSTTIDLSEQFWDEIRQHPIPADLNVVRALVNAPGCLDLYLWLVWRCFKLKRDAQIPLFGAYGLCQQLGTDDYLRARDLRRTLLRWLHVIQVFFGQIARRPLEATGDPSNCGPLGPFTLPRSAPVTGVVHDVLDRRSILVLLM